jgi:hypothetical protein
MPDHALISDPPDASLTLVQSLALGVMLVLAPWLGWKAWEVNIHNACWESEWPPLAVCEGIKGKVPEDVVAKLLRRVVENPADSRSLVSLAIWATPPDPMPGLDGVALLAAATKAAPHRFSVLRLVADRALQNEQWPQALAPLITLASENIDPYSTQTLALLISQANDHPDLAQALIASTKPDGGWLDRVLRAMPAEDLAVSSAMPMVEALMASDQLTPALGQFVIQTLKREGSWEQAHAVWRHFWKGDLPLVFNGNFERPFVLDGFDWTPGDANNRRSGARLSLVRRNDHGQVLQVSFSGNQISSPILRQDLWLPPGRYQLSGNVQSIDLQSRRGLTWVIICVQDGRELGRSQPLLATGRNWARWAMEISMPDDCSGSAAQLSLQTFAPYETKTGLRGDVLLDDVTMTPIGSAQ